LQSSGHAKQPNIAETVLRAWRASILAFSTNSRRGRLLGIRQMTVPRDADCASDARKRLHRTSAL